MNIVLQNKKKDLDSKAVYKAANNIRRRVMEHTIKNNGGYLSQACSSAEIFATLYLDVLNMAPVDEPLYPGTFPGVPSNNNKNYFTGANYHGIKSEAYDRFYLSPTHYSLVLYTALIEVNRMSQNGLDEFNKDGGVVEMIGAEHSPGMELMTGSLGQGISQASGIAMARKIKKETGRIVVFMSDGECQSGQFWECVQAMSHHKLDNMLIYIDANGYQCDGPIESVMTMDSFDKRLETFGARVYRINGHNVEALSALGKLPPDGRPTFIICDTDVARNISILKERAPKMHYVRFTSEEEKERYKVAFDSFKRTLSEQEE